MLFLDVPQSGSIAGTTSSRNRFGQYKRTRAIPVQPRTPKQTSNRALLILGSSSWKTLSDTDRTGWNDYAQQITRSGRMGSGYSPTGAMLYAGATVMAAGAIIDVPDALPDFQLVVTSMTYTDSTPGPEAFTVAISGTSAANKFIVETSGPVSAGITSAAAVRRWRSLPLSAANLQPNQFSMATGSESILANYKYLFPSPAPGVCLWFRFREIAWPGSGNVPVTNLQAQTYRLVIS